MIDKALLTGAFEKMGPERVERMLLAFGPDGETLSYCRCALGYAAGFERNTDGDLIAAIRQTDFSLSEAMEFLAHRLSITNEEADAIEDAHITRERDGVGKREAHEFLAPATEWLENRPASPNRASRETSEV